MDSVRIVEVGPRDGLQNVKEVIPLDLKLDFIEKLLGAGLKEIEVGAFVSSKWVPQMADSKAVIDGLDVEREASFWALVPNQRGMESFLETRLSHIAFFTAASDSFNKRNTNKTYRESLEVLKPLLESAKKKNLISRIYLSTVWDCPFEGRMKTSQLEGIFASLMELEFSDLSLGDTTGKGHPSQTKEVLKVASKYFPLEKVSCHFHDTYGLGLANVFAAMDLGVRSFDSSAGGLGGCPYAPGASGNLATEDLVFALEQEGVSTGIDLERLSRASSRLEEVFPGVCKSKVREARLKKC